MFWKKWEKYYDEGMLIIRLAIGWGVLYFHGWAEMMGGPERWERLGGAMSNIGIDFGHTFFGFMAAFSNTVAAFIIMLGLFFQPMLVLLAFTMFMASLAHVVSGRGNPGNAFTVFGVAVGLMFTGPGKYSLDAKLQRWLEARREDSDPSEAVPETIEKQ